MCRVNVRNIKNKNKKKVKKREKEKNNNTGRTFLIIFQKALAAVSNMLDPSNRAQVFQTKNIVYKKNKTIIIKKNFPPRPRDKPLSTAPTQRQIKQSLIFLLLHPICVPPSPQ